MQRPLLCVFAFLVLVGSSANGQTTAPTTNPASTLVNPPISFGDVAAQSEELSLSLRQLKTDLTSDRTIFGIEEELPILNNEIDARLDETNRLLGSNPSLQVLPTLESDWQAMDTKLESWKKILAGRSTQLKGEKSRLEGVKALWIQTQQIAVSRNVKAGIRQHIDAAITTINTAQQNVQTALEHVWSLLQNVDDQDARVLDVLSSIRQARQEAFSRLLVRDGPAVWTLVARESIGKNLIQESVGSFSIQLKGLYAYATRQKLAFVLHAFVFLVLAGALYWIKRGIHRTEAAMGGLSNATAAFDSPLLTSIVLSFMVSNWIYPQTPRLLVAIIGAAALIPTVMILRRLIDQRLFRILNAMVVFYFLDQLRIVVATQQVLPRLIFLLEMAGGILFLLSFIASTRASSAPPGNTSWLWKAMQIGARLALLVFAVAFLGNVFGYVSFANLIGDAMLNSAYLAIILYATTRIADGLLTIVLRKRPLSLLAFVRRYETLIQARLSVLVKWVAFAFWTVATLDMLSLRSAAYTGARTVLFAQLSVGSIQLSLAHVLIFVGTIWAAFFLSRLLRFLLEEDVYAHFPVPRGMSYAISKLLHYVILLVSFFVAIAALGYDLTKFAILAGAFSVGIGFGMQNIINNFVSGLILLFERPIKIGDLIQMDNATGVVQRIGIRATILRTTDSSEIIVPNGSILSSQVTNWTLSNRERGIEIPVGVAAGTDPKRVIEILKSVAAAHPLITKNPPPQAFFEKFNGDSFSFRLRAWTDRAEAWVDVSSDLAVAINSAFVKENIVLK
jgi:potassium efflux system protein